MLLRAKPKLTEHLHKPKCLVEKIDVDVWLVKVAGKMTILPSIKTFVTKCLHIDVLS